MGKCGLLGIIVAVCLLLEVGRGQRLEPSGPCTSDGTLHKALQNISSNSVVSLESGVHCLSEAVLVSGVDNITIVGLDQTDVVITCSDGVGLMFLNISGLTLRNLQIMECGVTGETLTQAVSLTQELLQLFFKVPTGTRVAVYLASVSGLEMEDVAITNTTGLGLAGINVVGDSSITNCRFSNNRQAQKTCSFVNNTNYIRNTGERIGGGAFFLFQDFVDSNISTCENLDFYSLTITNSSFVGNTECSDLAAVEFNYRDSLEVREAGYPIGGSGGITAIFGQSCFAVNVTTVSTVFEENSATYGSAAHVGIFQGASHSYAVFDNCLFTRNGFLSSEFDLDFLTSGGAIGVYNDLVSPFPEVQVFIHERRIGFVARDSNFTDNGAINGGAIEILSLVTTAVADLTDSAHFFIEDCVFTGNRATRGAAVYIQELKLHARVLGIQVLAWNIKITANKLETLGDITSISSSDSTAVFDVNAINVTLAGDCVFEDNIGSALQGTSSIIGIAGNVSIARNIGFYGAGIILQIAFLVILPRSSLDVSNNVARVYGGGLYVNQITSSPIPTLFDCFMYFNYDQFSFCDDCSFNTSSFSVSFTNNSALLAGTIFGSALLNCPWSQPLILTYNTINVLQILDTHFSHLFQFTPDPTGIRNVRTPVSRVYIENGITEYSLAPGEVAQVPIRPVDSLDQSISTILGSFVELSQGLSQTIIPALGPNIITGYTANSNLSTSLAVLGATNITTNIVVYSLDVGYRPAQVDIRVNLLDCPVGFEYRETTLRCECSQELLEREVECDSTNLVLRVPTQLWVGPVDRSTFAVGNCIRGLCEPGDANISVRNNSVNFDLQCRPSLNRGGVLCGSCLDGYTNVFGSPRCLKCSNNYAVIILLFLLLGALLIALLVIFPVNLSSGYLNGILFWANIVSLYERILSPSDGGPRVAVLANWLTLNLGIETCFHSNMSALERSWWELSFPLYLSLLMAVLRSVFKSKCCKVRAKTAFATIEAFATLLIMSYVSILQFSFDLLSTAVIYTEDNHKLVRWMLDPTLVYFTRFHGLLAFAAILLILFYIIPIPIIFLFPTVLYSNKFLKKYKPFYDTFWNPFKPRFRFWLGLRLIFRWVPIIMASFTAPPTSTFVTVFFLTVLLFLQLELQPFQSKWVNSLDSLFLLNLIMLFLGSLFFNAKLDDGHDQQVTTMRSATEYTSVLVVLAYIVMFGVFFYRMFVRFPKLTSCLLKCYTKYCAKKMKRIVLHVPQSIPDDATYVDGIPTGVDRTNRGIQENRPRVVGHTSFREPLLDEGSVEIHTYTTTTLPSSPTTFTNTSPTSPTPLTK